MSENDKYRERKKSLNDDWIVDGQIAALPSTYRYKAKVKPEEIQKDFENTWKDLRLSLEKHMALL